MRRYDGEIRWTDSQIGRVVGALRDGGELARTLVVLTADHGESLSEHDEYFQHGWFLYDTTLHVPLVIAWPAALGRGVTIDEQVSSVDLVPTLIELLALTPETTDAAAELHGRSVAHALIGEGDGAIESRPAFSVGPRENHPFSVRADGWKLIDTPAGRPSVPAPHPPLTGYDAPEKIELYDLAADPGETQNVAERHPERLEALAAVLSRFHETFRMSGMRW